MIYKGNIGGEEEDRTPDLRIANAALSQLSYPPTKIASLARSGQARAAHRRHPLHDAAEPIDLLVGLVERQRRTHRGLHPEAPRDRLLAMVTGAHGDALLGQAARGRFQAAPGRASRGRAARALALVTAAHSSTVTPRSPATTAAMRGSSPGSLRPWRWPAARWSAVA